MIRHLTPADYAITPWKNGRGTTTEIARAPAGDSIGCACGFGWRLSMAPVLEDGPFSSFPGVERTLVVTEGAGMELAFADSLAQQLGPLAAFTFDGGRPVTAHLTAGPIRDFNVMTAREHWLASVQILRTLDHADLGLGRSTLTALHVVTGRYRCQAERLPDMDLAEKDTLLLQYDRGAPYVASGDGVALLIQLKRVHR